MAVAKKSNKIELNEKNYFSNEMNKKYMSVSQFKSFIPSFGGCEANAMAILNNEWEDEGKTCFKTGHYMDAWNQGNLQAFKEENNNIVYTKSTRDTEDKKLYCEFQKCEDAIARVSLDKVFMEYLEGEKEVILTANLLGIDWKCKIDCYNAKKKYITDLKFIESLTKNKWSEPKRTIENFIQKYSYELQISIYAEIDRIYHNRAAKDYFSTYLGCVTKEKIINFEVINFETEDEDMDIIVNRQLLNVKQFLPRIIEVKSGTEKPIRCNSCDYCITTKKLTGTVNYHAYDTGLERYK